MSRRRSIILCLTISWTISVLLIVYYLSGVLPAGGMPFDDAWIHFVFARNLAEHGEVSFNPGQWSGGTTSLLWDVLLAIGYRLSDQMLTTAYVLGVICYLLAETALFYLMYIFEQSVDGRGLALTATIGFSMIGPLPYLALSGMDTLLFLALGLGSLAMFVCGHYGPTGWLLAAVVITRIEGLGLAILIGLATLAMGRERLRWRILLQVVVPPAIMLGFYLVFNWMVTGHLLPTTMAGRKWLWGLPANWWTFSLERTSSFLRDWGRLIAYFILAGGGWVPLLFLGGLIAAGGREVLVGVARRRPNSLGLTLLVGWVLVHNLAYVLLAPFATWRHQAPNLVLLPTLASIGLFALVRVLRLRYCWWMSVLGALGIFACLLPGTVGYRRIYVENVTHINRVHMAAGRWIDAHLPANAVVAAFDIGAVSYFGDRWTLDLGGLTEVRFVRDYLYPGRTADYLYEQGATCLVMPEPALPGEGADLTARLGLKGEPAARLRLRPLAAFEISPYIRPPFVVLPYQFYPAYRRIAIYEIEWLDQVP